MMWAMTESHSGLTLSGIIPSNISHSCNNTRNTCHKRDTCQAHLEEGGRDAGGHLEPLPGDLPDVVPHAAAPRSDVLQQLVCTNTQLSGTLGELRTEHRKL